MANATARVAKGALRRQDEFISHSSATLSSATTFYTGAMLGLTTGGYLAKFDDTQSLRFFGLVRGREGDPKLPAGTAGDGTIDIDTHQPPAFELAIASVAITDIGRRVYATYDQTGTLDPSATTYANYIGRVKYLVYATNGGSPVSGIALVEPDYSVGNGRVISGVYSASGAVTIKEGLVLITKSGVAALTIADPTSGVHDGLQMTFISSTAQAHTLSNAAGSGFNAGGAGTDVGTWGGAKGDGMQITAYGGVWLCNWLRNVTLG